MQHVRVQQVLESVEEKYLITLRNRITVPVLSDIRHLIMYIFHVYKKITPQQLKVKYDAAEKVP